MKLVHSTIERAAKILAERDRSSESTWENMSQTDRSYYVWIAELILDELINNSDVDYQPSSIDIQDLRTKTGAGLLNVKDALKRSGGNKDQVEQLLRYQGTIRYADVYKDVLRIRVSELTKALEESNKEVQQSKDWVLETHTRIEQNKAHLIYCNGNHDVEWGGKNDFCCCPPHKAILKTQRERDALVQVLDDEMISCHIGVFDLGDDPKRALNDIISWHIDVAHYFVLEQNIDPIPDEIKRLQSSVGDHKVIWEYIEKLRGITAHTLEQNRDLRNQLIYLHGEVE